jgi:putative SOS response-associated peptidase YedK
MRGHREPEHTLRGMQRGRACPRTPAAVDVLRSLRDSVDRRPVDGARHPFPVGVRGETLANSSMFRDAFRRHRSLVVADGFEEWRTTDVGGRRCSSDSGQDAPFGFGGIWSVKHGAKRLATCAITTCAPNELMAQIHDWMPMILTEDARDRWLDSTASEAELRVVGVDGRRRH